MTDNLKRVPFASLFALILGLGVAVAWGIYMRRVVSDTQANVGLNNVGNRWQPVRDSCSRRTGPALAARRLSARKLIINYYYNL